MYICIYTYIKIYKINKHIYTYIIYSIYLEYLGICNEKRF